MLESATAVSIKVSYIMAALVLTLAQVVMLLIILMVYASAVLQMALYYIIIPAF